MKKVKGKGFQRGPCPAGTQARHAATAEVHKKKRARESEREREQRLANGQIRTRGRVMHHTRALNLFLWPLLFLL